MESIFFMQVLHIMSNRLPFCIVIRKPAPMIQPIAIRRSRAEITEWRFFIILRLVLVASAILTNITASMIVLWDVTLSIVTNPFAEKVLIVVKATVRASSGSSSMITIAVSASLRASIVWLLTNIGTSKATLSRSPMYTNIVRCGNKKNFVGNVSYHSSSSSGSVHPRFSQFPSEGAERKSQRRRSSNSYPSLPLLEELAFCGRNDIVDRYLFKKKEMISGPEEYS
jgi:hypothetical protein